jgi:hypothetical protein
MSGGLKAFRARMWALLSLVVLAGVLFVLYLKLFVWPQNQVAVVYFEEARNIGLSTAVTLEGDGPHIGRVRSVTRRTDLNRIEVARLEPDTFQPLLSLQDAATKPLPRIRDWRLEAPVGGPPRITVWFDPGAGAGGFVKPRREGAGELVNPRREGAGELVDPRRDARPPKRTPPVTEMPIRVALVCGQRLPGTAHPLPDSIRTWEVVVESTDSSSLVGDPCLIPIGIEPADRPHWLPLQQFGLEGERLWMQVKTEDVDRGLAGATILVRDAAGGDAERVAFTADPHLPGLLIGRIAFADRALTPVVRENGRLEVRPPEPVLTFYPPAGWAQATLCGYAELEADHRRDAHTGPALALAGDEAACPGPKPARSLVESLERGSARLLPFAGERLLLTYHDLPEARRAIQEVELELEPSTGLAAAIAPDVWPFGFMPADTRARVSSQFGLRAPTVQIIPGGDSIYFAQGFDPGHETRRLVLQGAQRYSEDLSAVWSLLTDPRDDGHPIPSNRLEGLVLSTVGLVQDAHQLSTRLNRFSEAAGMELEEVDMDDARAIGGRLRSLLDRTDALLGHAGTLMEPLSARSTQDLASMLTDLRRISHELEPMARALAATDDAGLEGAPLLVREASDSLARINALLVRTDGILDRASALGGSLQERLEETDLKALGQEMNVLLEETRRVLRETEVLEYRLNRTWPLKKKPIPPEPAAKP